MYNSDDLKVKNNLLCVTITGADDSVDPEELFEISAKYPFVEWGILFSRSKNGILPRYPSYNWVEKLQKAKEQFLLDNELDINMSAHVCGSFLKEIVTGKPNMFNEVPVNFNYLFQRLQLNGSHHRYNDDTFGADTVLSNLFELTDIPYYGEYIFQVKSFYNALIRQSEHYSACSFLLDNSGGTGKPLMSVEVPFFTTDQTGHHYGYAGGLGPLKTLDQLKMDGNIISEIIYKNNMAENDNLIWLDGESRFFDGNRFDLERVNFYLDYINKAYYQ